MSKMVEITNSKKMKIADMVASSINGMREDTLKSEIINHIKYVPSIDEIDACGCFSRTARVVFIDIFAEKFDEIVGEDGRFYGSQGGIEVEGKDEAIERITGLLERISIRGIYTGVLDDGSEGVYVIDNITFKKQRIYLVNGQRITEEIVKEFCDGVDVLLIGDDIKKEICM